MLLWIMNSLETPQKRFPPFADDIAVPLEQLPNFVAAVQQILESSGTIRGDLWSCGRRKSPHKTDD